MYNMQDPCTGVHCGPGRECTEGKCTCVKGKYVQCSVIYYFPSVKKNGRIEKIEREKKLCLRIEF